MPDSRPGGHVLGNVPTPLSSFVGRAHERAELGGLLERSRLVTLTGPPGVGKTRLALETARSLVPSYPDGVWLVELESIAEAGLVPEVVASVLSLAVPERTSLALDALLVAELRDSQRLVVFDNCEHVIEGCARLAERLLQACDRLVILATSREPLEVSGECVRRLPPLAVPEDATGALEQVVAYDSVRLFIDRASAQQAAFRFTSDEAPAVVDICRRLDGIPLAIELAAAHLGVLSAAEIAEHLDERFRLLSTGSRTAPAHHKTLEAALDWSHELLSIQEASLLRRLAVFRGGCTLQAAEAVCVGQDVAQQQILTLLAALVRKSLVAHD